MRDPGDEAHPAGDRDTDEEVQDEPDEDSAAASGTRFANLPEFVEEFLLRVWRREPTAGCWCQRWWEHPEAVLRLEATWDAFELLRMEPGTGVSVWIRDHLDYHMGMLTTRATSPFKSCDVAKQRHNSPTVWPTAPAPTEMFQDICVEVDNNSSDWED